MRTKWLAGLAACVAAVWCAAPALAQGPPKPGPEHEVLKRFEGDWDAVATFGDTKAKATASFKLILGGRWLLEHFKADIGGAPFEGRGTTGYDVMKKKYVACWVDSMEPWMTLMEGTYDKDSNTLTETGEAPGPDRKLQKIKSVYEFKGPDSIVFTMYQVADGKDQQMMQITYTRKK
jgi:hypothetical protein